MILLSPPPAVPPAHVRRTSSKPAREQTIQAGGRTHTIRITAAGAQLQLDVERPIEVELDVSEDKKKEYRANVRACMAEALEALPDLKEHWDNPLNRIVVTDNLPTRIIATLREQKISGPPSLFDVNTYKNLRAFTLSVPQGPTGPLKSVTYILPEVVADIGEGTVVAPHEFRHIALDTKALKARQPIERDGLKRDIAVDTLNTKLIRQTTLPKWTQRVADATARLADARKNKAPPETVTRLEQELATLQKRLETLEKTLRLHEVNLGMARTTARGSDRFVESARRIG